MACAFQNLNNKHKKMSENLLIYIAVIIFVSIFVVALGVVIIVLIVQYINDKKKKKDQLLKVIIKGINLFDRKEHYGPRNHFFCYK